MAQQMSLKGRAFTASATAPRVSTRSVAVRAANKEQQVPFVQRLAPSMLAGLVALSTGLSTFDAVYAPAARADDEENMSPYERRQAELERRRELLREAREKAAARAAAPIAAPEVATPAPAAPTAPAAPSLSNSLQSYQAATQNRPSVPTPAPEPEAPSVPKWGGFNFSKPAAEEPAAAEKPAAAPAPKVKEPEASSSSMFSSDMWNTPIKPKAAEPAAPAPAAPAPVSPAPSLFKAPEPAKPKAPEPVKKPEVQKVEAKKAEAKKAEKPGKRRGPLPLWFAEILMLGAYAGLFLAVTKYSQQSGQVLKAVWAKVVEAYNALDKLINKPKTA